MAKVFVLSESDRQKLLRLFEEFSNRQISTSGRMGDQTFDHNEQQAPDFYVIITPADGIPALTLSGSTSIPGSATCNVYQNIDDNGSPQLVEVFSDQLVYNLSSNAIAADTFAFIQRDKFGTWWVITGGGSSASDGSFLVQLTAKCYSDGSPLGATPTTCAVDPLCPNRWIEYSWTRVTDTDDPCPLSYEEVAESGAPGCYPVYHVQNIDLPTFPMPSPRDSDFTTFDEMTETGTSETLVGWVNHSNAETSDDTYATSTIPVDSESNNLTATGTCLGLAGNLTITNITINVECHAEDGSIIKDVEVRLIVDGVISSNNLAGNVQLEYTDTVMSYSATPAAWGVTIDPLTVNSTDFGVAIRYKNETGSGTEHTVYVDHISLSVSYTPDGYEGVPHSIVRVWRGTGNYYVTHAPPWMDLFRKTAQSDEYGVIGYLRYWDPNTEEWKDGEEVRIVVTE